ncbi:Cupredoxin-like domain-containing protein [Paenibacillus catalpae]|uniref:Cupredoxin-like domain-containing protein n=1 Tax=Paenibacillus catalpae TaxID=1045775 RepID=A0A1I1UYE1_9BACL|nr:cupredoxin domain-containing protein [Paenibacillus catalpae]SFD75811.1 Cupredoxin-like domain-containing protein [Paenibacillus catalpae]
MKISIFKSTTMWLIALIIIVCVVFLAFFSSSPNQSSAEEPVITRQDGFQVATIQVKQDGFYPANIEVQAGVPVKLNFNKNTGITCIRSVLSKDLGIDTYLKKGDNFITLGNLKPGTYQFDCDMLMYHGTITVKA